MRVLFLPPGLVGAVALALLMGSGLAAGPTGASGTAPDDSTGAHIHTERTGDRLRVQGVFVNANVMADTLHYELSVRRSGGAGTTQSTQSGPFATRPGRADTLSTTQVNVQSGDTIDLRLLVRRADAPLDSARIRRTIP